MSKTDEYEIMNGTAVLSWGKDGKTTILTVKPGFLPLVSTNKAAK